MTRSISAFVRHVSCHMTVNLSLLKFHQAILNTCVTVSEIVVFFKTFYLFIYSLQGLIFIAFSKNEHLMSKIFPKIE